MVFFKKLVAGGMLGVLLAMTLTHTAAAATPDYSQLSPEARNTLLNVLIKQLTLLQEQLDIIRAAEKKAMIVESQPRPVDTQDYTKGAVNAPIKILTYTDFDCPFCKNFHTTLSSIVTTYPQVSITYRHFPLEQLHPNAKKLSIAAECVGQLGGDQAFFTFIDSVFNLRRVNDQTDMSKLESYAKSAGVQSTAFAACRASKTASDAVEADMDDAIAVSVMGTPTSYVFKNDKIAVISGAQPLAVVEEIIDNLLKQ